MSTDLISTALDRISPTDFELWVQLVLSKAENYTFAPTGGMHDGGQDGYIRPLEGEPDHYIQISKERGTSSKIRKTIKSIKTKRKLKKLTYITSQIEPDRDILEASLGREHSIKIIIHDHRWLMVQASLDEAFQSSLYGYVRSFLDSLHKSKNATREISLSDRLSILTYLEAQANSLPISEDFQNLCLDTIIYDSLIGTDPSNFQFKSYAKINKELQESHPRVLTKAPASLEDRLYFLSSKENFPRIRKHPNNNYALPYEVRNQFDETNVSLRNCEDSFVGSINQRIDIEVDEDPDLLRPYILSAIRQSIIEMFKIQAINFIASFE